MIISCNPREILHRPKSDDIVKTEMFNFQTSNMKSFHDFKMRSIDGVEIDFYKNKRSIHTASVTQVRQPIYTSAVERWRNYEKFLDPLLDALGDLAPKRS